MGNMGLSIFSPQMRGGYKGMSKCSTKNHCNLFIYKTSQPFFGYCLKTRKSSKINHRFQASELNFEINKWLKRRINLIVASKYFFILQYQTTVLEDFMKKET